MSLVNGTILSSAHHYNKASVRVFIESLQAES